MTRTRAHLSSIGLAATLLPSRSRLWPAMWCRRSVPRPPTFNKDVAPILYANCVSCHRAGEVGPMPLTTFAHVRPWASAIRQKVESRAMPPWHADRQHGSFRNDPSLTDQQIRHHHRLGGRGRAGGRRPAAGDADVRGRLADRQARSGVRDAGGLRDPGARHRRLPVLRGADQLHRGPLDAGRRGPRGRPRPRAPHHRLREGADAELAADGHEQSGRSWRPVPRFRRRWSRCSRSRPAASVLPAASRTGDSMLVNWAVGEDAPVFRPGMAKRIPAGSTLVFQVHYTTNGTPGRDRSRIGLVFAKNPPAGRSADRHDPQPAVLDSARRRRSPGGGRGHVQRGREGVDPAPAHAPARQGHDLHVTYPDGRQQIALRVPKFDFGWQTDYYLAEPLSLPKGSRIRVNAHFDNSAANRANPDPAATVHWGDQTWEEMMIGFLTYTVDSRGASQGRRANRPGLRPEGQRLKARTGPELHPWLVRKCEGSFPSGRIKLG